MGEHEKTSLMAILALPFPSSADLNLSTGIKELSKQVVFPVDMTSRMSAVDGTVLEETGIELCKRLGFEFKLDCNLIEMIASYETDVVEEVEFLSFVVLCAFVQWRIERPEMECDDQFKLMLRCLAFASNPRFRFANIAESLFSDLYGHALSKDSIDFLPLLCEQTEKVLRNATNWVSFESLICKMAHKVMTGDDSASKKLMVGHITRVAKGHLFSEVYANELIRDFSYDMSELNTDALQLFFSVSRSLKRVVMETHSDALVSLFFSRVNNNPFIVTERSLVTHVTLPHTVVSGNVEMDFGDKVTFGNEISVEEMDMSEARHLELSCPFLDVALIISQLVRKSDRIEHCIDCWLAHLPINPLNQMFVFNIILSNIMVTRKQFMLVWQALVATEIFDSDVSVFDKTEYSDLIGKLRSDFFDALARSGYPCLFTVLETFAQKPLLFAEIIRAIAPKSHLIATDELKEKSLVQLIANQLVLWQRMHVSANETNREVIEGTRLALIFFVKNAIEKVAKVWFDNMFFLPAFFSLFFEQPTQVIAKNCLYQFFLGQDSLSDEFAQFLLCFIDLARPHLPDRRYARLLSCLFQPLNDSILHGSTALGFVQGITASAQAILQSLDSSEECQRLFLDLLQFISFDPARFQTDIIRITCSKLRFSDVRQEVIKKLFQIAAGKQRFAEFDFFRIAVPDVLPGLISVCDTDEDLEEVLRNCLLLVQSSLSNKIQAQKGGLDLAVIDLLSKVRDSLQITSVMKTALAIVEAIFDVASSTIAVQRYLSLLVPINGQYLPVYQAPLLRSMTLMASTARSKPRLFIPIELSSGVINVKNIPSEELNRGFVITCWLCMEKRKDSKRMKLFSIYDDRECAVDVLVGSRSVWLFVENATEIGSTKLNVELEPGKWTVFSLYARPTRTCWEMFARIGSRTSSEVIVQWDGFEGKLVEIKTNIESHESASFSGAMGYLGGLAISKYDPSSQFHVEWESMYSKIPTNAWLWILPSQKDYVLDIQWHSSFPVSVCMKSRAERKSTGFVDILLNSVRVESLLPVIATASMPVIDGSQNENMCELGVDLLSSYMSLATDSAQSLDICILTLACLLKRSSENEITYGLYLRCVNLSTVIDDDYRRQFCSRILFNVDIWRRGGVLTYHRVLRHWKRVLLADFPDLFSFDYWVAKLSETDDPAAIQDLSEMIVQKEVSEPRTEHLERLVGFCIILTNCDTLLVFLDLIARIYSYETAPDVDYGSLILLHNLIGYQKERIVLSVIRVIAKCIPAPEKHFEMMFTQIPALLRTESFLSSMIEMHLPALFGVQCFLASLAHCEKQLLMNIESGVVLRYDIALLLMSLLSCREVEHLVFDVLIHNCADPFEWAAMIEVCCHTMKIPSSALDFLYRYLLVCPLPMPQTQFQNVYPSICAFMLFHSACDHARVMAKWITGYDTETRLSVTSYNNIKEFFTSFAREPCDNYCFGLRLDSDGGWKDLNLAKLCLMHFSSCVEPDFLLYDLVLCRFVLRFDFEFGVQHLRKIFNLAEKHMELFQIVAQTAVSLNLELPEELGIVLDPSISVLHLMSQLTDGSNFVRRLRSVQDKISTHLGIWHKFEMREGALAKKRLDKTALDMRDKLNSESQQWDAEALHKWRTFYRELSQGIWRQPEDSTFLPHYKRDRTLCGEGTALYPAKVRINHKHDDHLIAVLIRKTGCVRKAKEMVAEMETKEPVQSTEDLAEHVTNACDIVELDPASVLFEAKDCILVKCGGESACTFHMTKNQILIYLSKRVHQIQRKHVRRIVKRTRCHVHRAIEIFTVDHRSYFLVFASPEHVRTIMKHSWFVKGAPLQTCDWVEGNVTNFEYLLNVNFCSGRTYNSPSQYPMMPWILSDYSSEKLNLEDPAIFRDLSLPVAAISPEKRNETEVCYSTCGYFYGAGPISPAVVYRYLIRLEPFTSLHVRFQGGRFDCPERLFQDIGRCFHHAVVTEQMELIPELFFCPEILVNRNHFDLGTRVPQDDVRLPAWASSPIDFIYQHRKALESDYVSQHLNDWIDLMFGAYQKDADHLNIYSPFLYEGYGPTETMGQEEIDAGLMQCGQIPTQLFKKPHPKRKIIERSSAITSVQSCDLGFPVATVVAKSVKRPELYLCGTDNSVSFVVFSFSHDKVSYTVKATSSNKRAKIPVPCFLTKHLLFGVEETRHRVVVFNRKSQTRSLSNILFGDIQFVSCDDPILMAVGTDSTATFWRYDFLETPLFVIESTHGVYTCGCIRNSFDLAVLGSADGVLELISLQRRKVMMTVVMSGHTPHRILVSRSMGFILVYSSSATEPGTFLTLFTVNGEKIKTVNFGVSEKITGMEQFVDHKRFDYVMFATSSGKVYVFELYYMKPSILMRNVGPLGALHYDRKSGIVMHFSDSGTVTCAPFMPK